MRTWRTLAIVGLAFGLGGISWGYAQQRKSVGFFELRIYTTKPRKRKALAARFGDYTTKIYSRHGIANVGDWFAASNVCPTHPWAMAKLVVQRVQAVDPWQGTWRLDVARSSFSPGPPPMSQTIEIQSRDGDGLYVVTNGVDARGRPTHTERTARFDGMDYPAQGFDQPTTQAFTRINDRSYGIVSKAGGRIITRTRVTVSRDGKTMTTVTAGDVGQGPLNNTQVLENVKR